MERDERTVHELTIPDSGFPKTCFTRLLGTSVLLTKDNPAYHVGDLMRLKSESGNQIGREHTITAIRRYPRINECTIDMWDWKEYIS